MSLMRLYSNSFYAVIKVYSIRHLLFTGMFFAVFSSLLLGVYGYSRIQNFAVEMVNASGATVELQSSINRLNET